MPQHRQWQRPGQHQHRSHSQVRHHSHQPTGPLLPFALPVFSCAMRAGLPSPQLLSRRASPRYRRLDLGVLSISLVHFGTVYSVSRSPYIAMAGLGKASRLSPRLRELLAHLADHATELVDDRRPADRSRRLPRAHGAGAGGRGIMAPCPPWCAPPYVFSFFLMRPPASLGY